MRNTFYMHVLNHMCPIGDNTTNFYTANRQSLKYICCKGKYLYNRNQFSENELFLRIICWSNPHLNLK